jgi:hypothetical protein
MNCGAPTAVIKTIDNNRSSIRVLRVVKILSDIKQA